MTDTITETQNLLSQLESLSLPRTRPLYAETAKALGSNRFKRLMMDYLTEKDISFQPIRDLRLREEDETGTTL